MGGPPPIGVQKAKLTPFIKDIITQFALQEFGHLRAIKKTVPGFPRPLMDLSALSFARVMNMAVGKILVPPFDPYADDIKYLLASYLIPFVGLTGYVGANPLLESPISKALVVGLLGVESGQDAVIRTLLYERALMKVFPYDITVAEFTNKISNLRNKLGKRGLKDEGLIVKPSLGAEGKISGNVLAGNQDSLSYGRTPAEILRIVYGSGREDMPGGFYPRGANGRIARSFLQPDQ
ncbi:desiccation-related protein pcc13-62 [Phtheirospermum japonicum]|uniref:Desiccation-related protein pcc13-62 n=1 Tax=Phtheirospermum japonicum TaxID=374723 RepID=A0A830CM17_9LAMI|nr:desiccation-related protein pcc13-62 [Phtheirospermum japonicum]